MASNSQIAIVAILTWIIMFVAGLEFGGIFRNTIKKGGRVYCKIYGAGKILGMNNFGAMEVEFENDNKNLDHLYNKSGQIERTYCVGYFFKEELSKLEAIR